MRRRDYELKQQNPPRPKRKYGKRQPEVVMEREPAQKFRLTREDVFRSVNGRGYGER